ncbi:MAG: hypothetical protein WA081_02450 [Desulfosalsimonadaceae bacterium]
MKKKSGIGRQFILSLLVWSMVLSGFSTLADATPYQPDGTIRIITQGSSGDADSGDDAVEWRVETEKSGPGSASVYFTMAGSDQPVCRLIAASDTGSVSLVWTESGRRPQVIQQADLLIVPGSPVPVDRLPPDMASGKCDSRNYEIKRQVGGQAFTDHFQVTSSEIDGAAARTNRWLTGDDAPGKLVMITVVNARTNALVVRQLWAPGAAWWIFEETPYHQSRQVR